MEPSVSPLPVPLWPMLALSLTLFCGTATAVAISAHHAKQVFAAQAYDSPELPATFPMISHKRPKLAANFQPN